MIRRAWRVLADPPTSDTAFVLRNLGIPACTLFAALPLMPFWEGPVLSRFADLVWMFMLLYVVRQRDTARIAARCAVSLSHDIPSSRHPDMPPSPPAATTGPHRNAPTPTARHRNEAP